MRLDPDAQATRDALSATALPPFETLSPGAARAQLAALRAAAGVAGPEVALVRDVSVGGVPARFYAPVAVPDLPLIVYAHGGGWVLGGLDSHDAFCRALALATGAALLAVDYRLAPEHPFPAALDDLHTALAWVGAGRLRDCLPDEVVPDPMRIVLAGDSAGGNLAAVVATEAPALCAQILLCPVLDARLAHPSHGLAGPGLMVTGATMRWFRDHYAGGADPADPRLSPLAARDVAGLPPTFLVTAGVDPLCDEGLAYAARLAGAGVPLTHLHYPGQMHGFMTGNPASKRVAALLAVLSAALALYLGEGGARPSGGR